MTKEKAIELLDIIRSVEGDIIVDNELRDAIDVALLALSQQEQSCEDFDTLWEKERCDEYLQEGGKLSPNFRHLFKEVCRCFYELGKNSKIK